MTPSLAQSIEERRRRVILHILDAARANESILQTALDRVGLATSRDGVRTSLSWLAEQGLVHVEDVDGLTVAALTRRGLDVAEGRARVPGVADRHD